MSLAKVQLLPKKQIAQINLEFYGTPAWNEEKAKQVQQLLNDLAATKDPEYIVRWLRMAVHWRKGGRRNKVKMYTDWILRALNEEKDVEYARTILASAKRNLSRMSFWRLRKRLLEAGVMKWSKRGPMIWITH